MIARFSLHSDAYNFLLSQPYTWRELAAKIGLAHCVLWRLTKGKTLAMKNLRKVIEFCKQNKFKGDIVKHSS